MPATKHETLKQTIDRREANALTLATALIGKIKEDAQAGRTTKNWGYAGNLGMYVEQLRPCLGLNPYTGEKEE
jgi:hypothetical protein